MKNAISIFAVVVFASAAFYYVNRNQDELKQELIKLNNYGISSLVFCSIQGANVANECKEIKNTEELETFKKSIESSIGASAPGHTEWSFEKAIQIKTTNSEKWYRAVEYKGHKGVFYVSRIEMNKNKTFKYIPGSVIMNGISELLHK